jgi:hypothetical protein
MSARMSREAWMEWARQREPDFDAWLVEAGRVVVPCDCDYEGCRGWVVRSARLVGEDSNE